MDATGLCITVAQLLFNYYDKWRDYDGDIEYVCKIVDELAKSSTALRSKLASLETDGERSARVLTSLGSFEQGLTQLQAKQLKICSHKEPTGFLKTSRRHLKKSKYPFKAETLEKVKDNVRDLQGCLSFALDTLNLDLGIEMRDRSVNTAANVHQTLTQAQNIADNVLDLKTTQQYDAMRRWLSAPNPDDNHDAACGKCEEGTGRWLLDCDRYLRWRDGSDQSILWLTGKAGCGKTVLCSSVIEDVRKECPKATLIYFYFSFSDQQKQDYNKFLSSLVTQLLDTKLVCEKLKLLHEQTRSTRPTSERLEETLAAWFGQQRGRVVLVMDAFDELPKDDEHRGAVLDWLERVVTAGPNLRILVTSRNLKVIEDAMDSLKAETILVDTERTNADIYRYVAKQLQDHRALRKLDASTKEKIQDKIGKKADGMFQWAFCQLKELKQLETKGSEYVKSVLNDLPPDLDGTTVQEVQYDAVHTAIDGFGSYTDHFMRCPVFRGIGGVAHKYYMLFQHHLPPPASTFTTDAPQTTTNNHNGTSADPNQLKDTYVMKATSEDPSYIIGTKPGPYVEERSRNLYCQLGKRIAFMGIDARTERTRHQINYPETYDLLFREASQRIGASNGQIRHLVLLLGVPIAYPRLQWLENILQSPIIGPIRFLNKRFGIAGGLFNTFDGNVDLLDDLDDHYTAHQHKKERKELILRLQELSKQHNIRISILGGDVHLAALGRFYSKPHLKIPAEADWRYMPNIISSAITNKPPPQPVANLLARRNKIHHLDHETDETLLELFDKDPADAAGVSGIKPKSAANNHATMPSRNYAIITESHASEPTMTNGAVNGESPAFQASSNPRGALHKGEEHAGVSHPAAQGIKRTGLAGKDGLDVTIRVEINQSDREGHTQGYGFSVPALDVAGYKTAGQKW